MFGNLPLLLCTKRSTELTKREYCIATAAAIFSSGQPAIVIGRITNKNFCTVTPNAFVLCVCCRIPSLASRVDTTSQGQKQLDNNRTEYKLSYFIGPKRTLQRQL